MKHMEKQYYRLYALIVSSSSITNLNSMSE